MVFVLAASSSGQFSRCSDLLTMPRNVNSLSYNIKRARSQPFFAVCLGERAKKCICVEVALHYCSCFDVIYTLLYEIAVDLGLFFPQTVLHCEAIQGWHLECNSPQAAVQLLSGTICLLSYCTVVYWSRIVSFC